MILLVSGATRAIDQAASPNVGRLYVPRDRNVIRTDRPWAIDNGAFSGFDEAAFLRLLRRAQPYAEQALWVAAPDVVGDANATLRLFAEWGQRIRAMRYRVALILQDGLDHHHQVPWDAVDALFIGGTTDYKLSPEVAYITQAARRRGTPVHMGRVNSTRRIRYAARIGCTSIDGSRFSRFPDTHLPGAINALDNPQTALEIH